jgi:TonB family protein
LLFLLFFVGFPKIKVPPPAGKEQKISLNLSQFKTPPPAPKPVVVPPQPKPVPVQPPVPKPIVKPIIKPVEKVVKPAPVVKKKLIDDKKRIFVEKVEKEDNNITKTEPKKEKKLAKKEEKKKVQKKKVTKKRVVKKRKPQRKKSNNPLANALMGSGTSMYPTQRSSASSGSYSARMINQLYGKEFGTFSSTQKKFIKHNLGTIHRITQRTLNRNGYPEVAVRTRQEGTNVVSFYLHPNGDISGLRLKTRIGYAALDNNTLEVIRIAYKDYPLPNQKTKIVFYVQYSIY